MSQIQPVVPSFTPALDRLADSIIAEHSAVTAGLQHALTAGQLLLEAKAKIEHGRWREFIEVRCGLTMRTAQLYMRVHRKVGNRGGEEAQRVAHSATLREAQHLLADKRVMLPVHAEPQRSPAPITIVAAEEPASYYETVGEIRGERPSQMQRGSNQHSPIGETSQGRAAELPISLSGVHGVAGGYIALQLRWSELVERATYFMRLLDAASPLDRARFLKEHPSAARVPWIIPPDDQG